MKIIGIDPGFGRVGYGLTQKNKNSYKYICSGIISTNPNQNIYDRLNEIEKDLQEIIKQHKPTYAVVEKLYFNQNTTTAMQVSEARGVICNLLNKNGVQIQEITPLQIKSSLTGNGRANKKQVEQMVKLRLNIENIVAIDDAIDALAASLCFNQISFQTSK